MKMGYNATISGESLIGMSSWAVPALIISIIGAIIIFCVFLSKKNEDKFIGFKGWLYDFLHFKKLAVDAILKILYMAMALYISIMAIITVGYNFVGSLLLLVLGNIGLRIAYELILVVLIICKNTTEINKKLSQNGKITKG